MRIYLAGSMTGFLIGAPAGFVACAILAMRLLGGY